MLRKKRLITPCIVLLLICALSGVCFAASGFAVPQKFSLFTDFNEADAVFGWNGEILYFDSKSGDIKVLSSEGQYSPLLSPDHTKILYRKSVFETDNFALIFGAIDMSGNTVFDVTIDTPFSNDILGLQWISDSLVGITTHVNPSSSECFVYDVGKEEFVKRFVGNSFAVIPGTDLVMYEKNVPHWSDEPVRHSFLIEDTVVYTTESVNIKLSTPIFSPDLTKVAFIETPVGSVQSDNSVNQTSKLVICDFNPDALLLQKADSISIDAEISGQVAFNEKNDICLVGANAIYWYNKESNSFVQEVADTILRNNAVDSKKYTKLQKAITDLYGDTSLENIYSINWIE